jgi:hypothetical protein
VPKSECLEELSGLKRSLRGAVKGESVPCPKVVELVSIPQIQNARRTCGDEIQQLEDDLNRAHRKLMRR